MREPQRSKLASYKHKSLTLYNSKNRIEETLQCFGEQETKYCKSKIPVVIKNHYDIIVDMFMELKDKGNEMETRRCPIL